MKGSSTERTLVLRAQSGDRRAFDRLLRDLAPSLLQYVGRVTGDGSLAEDVVQDTLILIVRKIRWLNEPSLLRPWAYRIASREAFRALRKRKVAEPSDVESIDEVATAPEEISDPWQRERLLSSIERLSSASRAVIILHYFEEMSLSEVAAVLDLPPGTVKSRLATGLTNLRKEIHP